MKSIYIMFDDDIIKTHTHVHRFLSFTIALATELLILLGILATALSALPPTQVLHSLSTSLNLTLLTPATTLPFPARTSRAVGAHSLLKLQGMPSLDERPLSRTVDLPTRTRSCGNDLSSLTGEFGESSHSARALAPALRPPPPGRGPKVHGAA